MIGEGSDDGDVLVFMPGRREIDRTIEACRRVAPDLDIVPLHGTVSAREQDRAVSARGPRRVVVATNVAETSITIPRVTMVIDSGLAWRTRRRSGPAHARDRRDRPGEVVQRAGRAGRVRPGLCIRLYTESETVPTGSSGPGHGAFRSRRCDARDPGHGARPRDLPLDRPTSVGGGRPRDADPRGHRRGRGRPTHADRGATGGTAASAAGRAIRPRCGGSGRWSDRGGLRRGARGTGLRSGRPVESARRSPPTG